MKLNWGLGLKQTITTTFREGRKKERKKEKNKEKEREG
jgi:hypothetical protein